jgi:hypothetical protein
MPALGKQSVEFIGGSRRTGQSALLDGCLDNFFGDSWAPRLVTACRLEETRKS